MNLAAKLLANDDSIKFHALQIIFIRMISTSILCSIYCWYHSIPDFPFGKRGIRWLLVLRGSAGFLGLFGLYCKCILCCQHIFFRPGVRSNNGELGESGEGKRIESRSINKTENDADVVCRLTVLA